jgi:signal transduction histidine kinase
VAGGIAERLEIDATVIRLSFVVLAFAGGVGVVLYLFGWLIGADPAPASADGPQPRAHRATGTRQVVAVALVVTGLLLLLRQVGLWPGDALMWSVGLAAFGSAILWTRSDDSGRARLARLASRLSPVEAATGRSKGRLAIGILLVLAGMGILLAANTSWNAIRNVAVAVLVTVAGLGLILGPWMFELIRQLSDERRQRIRSEERAEVAAHLHDSVLQTLAMIQRSSSSQEMVGLARAQERELRAWLYGRAPTNGTPMLSVAVDEMAARTERLHRVPVEAVVVGDAALDGRLRALVDAAGEATSNAARHADVASISVYVEVGPEGVSAYVRDEGRGFDPTDLPADRRGIAESIVGRMERHGGTATVTSERAQGTEVHLWVPRAGS